MRTRTKIICTMGPAVSSYEKILALIDAGMNGARLNFSHGSYEEHLAVIKNLKRAREEKKTSLAIILDTKGPELRIGKMQADALPVEVGQRLRLVKDKVLGDVVHIQLVPAMAIDALDVGVKVLFDDGYIISHVVEKMGDSVVVEIENRGILKSNKGVNIPGVQINLPAMTGQDRQDISFGCEHDIDIIAASFIRSADHVLEIKRLLVEKGKSDIHVWAKIENSQGVQNFESIVQVADGIMVARGDLGVELPLEQVPSLQKMMIRKCYHTGKPVITATQMLESMIKNPRPTRAEVSDVANAIYDSTSAVMLSGETAVGLYPVETVQIMKKIIEQAEGNFNYKDFFSHDAHSNYHDVSSSVAQATVRTAYSASAKAIFAFTSTGSTARLISRYRPEMPIVALSPSKKTYQQLALSWGVFPVDPMPCRNIQEAFSAVSQFCLKNDIVRFGDLVVVTAGSPFGISGSTNMMIVESIGDVLVRGHPGHGKRIHGKVLIALSVDGDSTFSAKDKIVVISRCDDSYLPLLKHAAGIVLQNHPDDILSEKHALLLAKTLDIPMISRAQGAVTLLQEGLLVTLDPKKGIVYKESLAGDEVS